MLAIVIYILQCVLARMAIESLLWVCTLICLAVSVMKMAELGFDDDILPPAPCRAVRNLEWIKEGFGEGYRMRWALSRTRRK